ncbi:hypothetical protein [Pacificispira sp.]|uniref:hypothetical protein n=1 Tax=Pacificispira sp. TaxID=2888761 RepID=UPI003B51739E
MPKWAVGVLVWAVWLSGFFVWMLPIPEVVAKAWTGVVAILFIAVVVLIAWMILFGGGFRGGSGDRPSMDDGDG